MPPAPADALPESSEAFIVARSDIEPLHNRSSTLDSEQSGDTSAFMQPSTPIRGEVKLSISYQNQSLCVLINHVKDLFLPDGQAPDSYVKTYLLPDATRSTKRKTKVCRKSHHPTFNEMVSMQYSNQLRTHLILLPIVSQLIYRMPLQLIKYRVLVVTVWHYDRMRENQFLGGINIGLENLFARSIKATSAAADDGRYWSGRTNSVEKPSSASSASNAQHNLAESKWYPLGDTQ